MTTIVTRAGKGSPLTNTEVDSNFTNLNTAKIETLTSTDTSVTITGTGSSRDLSVPVNPNVVSGPASATANAVPRFNSTTGKLIKNSGVTIDDNNNISVNSVSEGYSNIAAAGTTIVLTVASAPNYVVTGSGGQTYQLPDATTLASGFNYTFNNNQSSGTIVVKNNSSTTIATIQSGGFVNVSLLSNATAAGSWDVHTFAPSNVSWSTNTFDYAGSITSATWNGNTIQVNKGGTGATSLTGYVKGNGTSAFTASSTVPTTDLSGTVSNAQLANSSITINGNATALGGSVSVGTVTSVTGTAPVVSSGGNTPAISMAAATTSVNGYLTSTDWNTFNGKQAALVSGTNIKTVNSTSLLGSGDVSVGVTSVTGTAPVVSSGGATPAISMAAANTTTSGYLTSTDWNTFNNKQPAGSYLTTAVTSATAGTGISVSASTGAVTFTNTGVTSLTAGTGISLSGSTGGVTITNTASGASITDDTTTNATRYPLYSAATSGTASTVYTSSSKYTYNPSTGALTATSHVSSSDERLKTNWRGLATGFISKLAFIKSGVFDRTDFATTEVGVSAQSLQALIPEAVVTDEKGYLSVNYGGAALVAAIELAKEVKELRAEIAILKQKVNK